MLKWKKHKLILEQKEKHYNFELEIEKLRHNNIMLEIQEMGKYGIKALERRCINYKKEK